MRIQCKVKDAGADVNRRRPFWPYLARGKSREPDLLFAFSEG